MPRKVKSPLTIRLSPALKELSLCVLSAVLLMLSFPKYNLEFLAWFGFVPAFFALNNKSLRKVFFLFFITGIIFWSGIIYWLVHVTLAGTAVLILYLALYFAVFGLAIRNITKRSTPYVLIFIPSIWVLLEYLRSHLLTGFPWALLGYSQYLNLPVIQIADITGVWGVSFMVMMVNTAVYSALSHKSQVTSHKLKYLLPILCVFICLIYGYFKLQYLRLKAYNLRPIKISVIQGNIPQEMKWDPRAKDYIVDKYLYISRESLKDNPDLIVWPEASLPVVLEEEPAFFEKIKGFVNEIGTPLLLGGVTSKDGTYYNSALLVSDKGVLLKKHDKLHLVPFGEYMPLRKRLWFLERVVPIGDFSCGKEHTVFNLPITPCLPAGRDYPPPAGRQGLPITFSVLICFEDLFPELSRGFVKRGADFLANITNDAWFGKTAAPYQHASASVFRAVENRVSLLRSANTGVSGFISPAGKIIARVADNYGKDIFIDGYNTQGIIISKRPLTLYTRYGDYFILACFLAVLYGLLLTLRKSKVKSFKP